MCGLLMDVQGPLGNELTAGSHDRPEDFYPRILRIYKAVPGEGEHEENMVSGRKEKETSEIERPHGR